MITETSEANRPLAKRLSSQQRVAIIISLLVGLAIQAGLTWQLRVSIANGFTDFQEFYGAAMVVRTGKGSQLFDASVQSSVQQAFTHRTLKGISSSHYYNHAPYEVLLYLPLTWFSFARAAWYWWAINLLLLYGSLYLLLPFLPHVAKRLQSALLGMAIFVPLLIAEIQGQDTILTLFLFVFCFTSLMRDRFLLAGSALAITMYKPPLALPMLILVALTARKRFAFLAGFVGTSVLLFFASVAAGGWTCTVTYPQALAGFASSEGGHWHLDDLPNIRGLANSLLEIYLSQKSIFIIVLVASAIIVVLSIWVVRSRNRQPDKRTQFALFVTATLLVGYQEYAYDMTLLLLALVLVWDRTGGEVRADIQGKFLSYAVPVLLCTGSLALLHSQVFACALSLFFVLICLGIRQAESAARPALPAEA